jgi:hypothetical protein
MGSARQEDDQAGGQDGPQGIHEAVLHQQRGAHGLQDQEGGGAEGGVGHPPFDHLRKRCGV